MEINIRRIKNEIKIFLLATFLITYGMGIVMLMVYKRLDGNASAFALVQMLHPALVVIGIKIYYEKDNIKKGLMDFFKVYIIFTILSTMTLMIGIFVFPKYVEIVLGILVCIISIITFTMIMSNKDNCFEWINMVVEKNINVVMKIAVLFLGIYPFRFVLYAIFSGDISGIDATQILSKILFSPITIFFGMFSFILFFGEEFGWRGYLQPRLQVLLGKKLGVIILGFIWGIWHLPLCFMLYSPESPIHCVLLHVFYCILMGIFMGYAYMKSGNLWSAIIIHLINNGMAESSVAIGGAITLNDLLLGIIINAIVFIPFLFTKEYKTVESGEELWLGI
ncbi:CPBP family intramembrane glutamic endopeptidase [Oceanirhabdus sp. W0125-5]|uniref:CPBP family intramembrane glutamic endopeptidase n=1 Tax=Oceanirhabdus sp. W0125-5 TaxID=2999116 RepID=UPI0022F2C1A2|nr:type II CAAX endopeptidase family protein [Oceanirhabdus sp. W0125-5]WBW95183.1 type II CAAX endopeptidase family protein [Oceanirhabdus sp. W0125-5]